MKNTATIIRIMLAIGAVMALTYCRKMEWDNPYDDKGSKDPEVWSPDSLTLKSLSITHTTLSWIYIGGVHIDGFRIDRKKGNDPWQIGYGKVSAKQLTFTDSLVIPVSLYYKYRVSAIAGNNVSNPREDSLQVFFPGPTDARLQKISQSVYKISWEDNTVGEQGFKIDKRVDTNEVIEAYAVLPPNTEEYTDENVFGTKGAVNIEYIIYAYYAEASSENVVVNTNASLTAPSHLIINRTALCSATLTWTDNSNGEQGFIVERSYDNTDWESIGTTTDPTFTDQTFHLKTTVYYRVCAYSSQYRSSYTTKQFSAVFDPPSNVTIQRNSVKKATISWTDNTDGEDGFLVERKQGSEDWTTLTTTTQSAYIDESFALNTTVYYRVSAYKGEWNSGAAANSFSSTIQTPTTVTINRTSLTTAKISWSYISTGEAGFRIERRIGVGNWTLVGTTNALNIQDEGYPLNETITYRVFAYIDQNYSDFASQSFSSIIPSPTNLTSVINSSTSATLNWQYSLQGIEGFSIDRKTNNDDWEISIATLSNPNQLSYTDNSINLVNNSYIYRVYAYSGSQVSAKSEVGLGKPTISTTAVTSISYSSASGGGTVLAQGSSAVTARGICWSTTPNPTTNDNHTTNGSGTGTFTSQLTNLSTGTTYYVRAYAVNSAGTSYGEEVTFQTLPLAIGAHYGGGIVFYLDGQGGGLICTESDQTSTVWGTSAFLGQTGTDIGTGQANTTSIANFYPGTSDAASVCDLLVLNGYSDWYLPSKDELNLMHKNLCVNSTGNFSYAVYWSSSNSNQLQAWGILFNQSSSTVPLGYSIYNNMHVRAVRSF